MKSKRKWRRRGKSGRKLSGIHHHSFSSLIIHSRAENGSHKDPRGQKGCSTHFSFLFLFLSFRSSCGCCNNFGCECLLKSRFWIKFETGVSNSTSKHNDLSCLNQNQFHQGAANKNSCSTPLVCLIF